MSPVSILFNITCTLAGILFGIAATWVVSWHFDQKSREELAHEAKRLRELNIVLARGLEDLGVIVLQWKDGEPVNVTLKQTVPTIGVSATPTRSTLILDSDEEEGLPGNV